MSDLHNTVVCSTTASKKLLYGLDPSKYPSRMGQPWKKDEVAKLLTSIQSKKSHEEIAADHDRTVGGIVGCLRKLAVDYHIKDRRPMFEIQRLTGLSTEQIEDAIKRHELKDAAKKAIPIALEIDKPSEIIETVGPKRVETIEQVGPTRVGLPWSNDEIEKLLTSIQSKKTHSDIAIEHGRTVGGILGCLKKIAADYHSTHKYSTDEIQRLTGLNNIQIEEAIRKFGKSKVKKETKVVKVPIQEVLSLLKEISSKLDILISRTE